MFAKVQRRGDGEKTRPVTIHVPSTDFSMLWQTAKDEGETLSHYVASLIHEHFQQQEFYAAQGHRRAARRSA